MKTSNPPIRWNLYYLVVLVALSLYVAALYGLSHYFKQPVKMEQTEIK